MNEEKLAVLELFLAADIGAVRFFKLLEVFGNAKNTVTASAQELMSVYGIGEKTALAVSSRKFAAMAENEIKNADKNNIKIVFYDDADYPENLKNIPDKPVVLYIKGDYIPQDFNAAAIVGSRRASAYGKNVTEEFAACFAQNNLTVISGLARGVDSYAHKAALENNGRTIAVLGNGLLVNYPPENKKLQDKIPESGAVISEFALNVQPNPGTFPRRNRIVAALSKAVLVTEAVLASGALITAKLAAQYGKDVFAVPGSIYSNLSKGTNMLLENGAFIALNPWHVTSQITGTPIYNSVSQKDAPKLTSGERKVLEFLENIQEGAHTETIAQKLNITIAQTAAILFQLEMKDLVKAAPGQIYIKVR
ncbi:DNA-processing protein DprA [Endomicrobium proavitum]|uniref:DprA-like DNA processing protein n=1 Tax=Endomicrobium proavitum TaxID=1408281 RepID=A0A0G3WKB3_9BACT|nr:DNA-processing protein DprA [Endomicrobium proavitum]AKL98340.1 DprA-like DNA processing protein [Endomicrobium proavitum]